MPETRVRYGYRRIHVLLLREGWHVNPKRVYRLYKELGLQLLNYLAPLIPAIQMEDLFTDKIRLYMEH